MGLDEGGERGGDFVDALVEEQVGVLVLVLEIVHFVEVLVASSDLLTSEALCFEIPDVELCDQGVIELVPFPLALDVRVVVPALRGPRMHQHPDKFILEITLLLHLLDLLAQMLFRILGHVEFERELEVVVEFVSEHRIVIKFESFQGEH